MAQSEFTKNCRRKLWLYRILDWICLLAPLIIYCGIGLSNGGVTVAGKVGLVSTIIIALALTGFNVIAQKRLRCPIWILLIGLYVAMKEVLLPLVIILAVTSVLDDLVFTPLISYYHSKTIASKTMDQREYEKEGQESL